MKKYIKLFLILVIAGVVIFVGYNLITRKKSEINSFIKLKEGIYQLGEIIVDTVKREIQFRAQVQKRDSWVQHLVYLEGYKWLKEESAIISEAKLADLQKAIALLDWKLWDKLWYRKESKIKDQTSKVIMSIKLDGVKMPAQELVMVEDKLEIGDFIFLGSPYFDHVALEAHPGVDCRLCPVFPLEEKALRETFVRESGQSGYKLNSERMPAQGAEVSIILELK